ncbi:hypothetical protein GEMRC1_008584 [Eukaryota sp. GEM-RC1]
MMFNNEVISCSTFFSNFLSDMTSRIIVRGFPDTSNEASLRKHFQHIGSITDVKVITSNGKSRRFGFIGFSSESDASSAVDQMNGTFMGMAKVNVDFARPRGDSELPRPWSKYTKEKESRMRTASSDEPLKKKKKKSQDTDSLRREIWNKQQSSDNVVEQIADSGKLFVRNLPYSLTDDQFRQLFEKYGEISSIDLPFDSALSSIRGYGRVDFLFPKDAVTAYSELDNTYFQGRILHILPGIESDPRHQENEKTSALLGYKKAAELSKQQSSTSSHNWNSLFVRSDTAVTAAVEDLGTTKEDFYSENGAVRAALAESSIVTQAKEVLRSHGVNLDVLANRNNVERSSTIILVKNIAIDSTEDEIEDLFGQYGPIISIICTPHNALCIVEFAESSHCKRAFRKLAYKNHKGQPLYLELAPMGLKTSAPLIGEEDLAEAGATVYIKNIAPSATEDQLKHVFSEVEHPKSVSIVRRKSSGDSLSFGFAEFSSKSVAVRVITNLNGKVVEGNALDLSLAKTAAKPVSKGKGMSSTLVASKSKKGQSNTKIMVKNVPFGSLEKRTGEAVWICW